MCLLRRRGSGQAQGPLCRGTCPAGSAGGGWEDSLPPGPSQQPTTTGSTEALLPMTHGPRSGSRPPPPWGVPVLVTMLVLVVIGFGGRASGSHIREQQNQEPTWACGHGRRNTYPHASPAPWCSHHSGLQTTGPGHGFRRPSAILPWRSQSVGPTNPTLGVEVLRQRQQTPASRCRHPNGHSLRFFSEPQAWKLAINKATLPQAASTKSLPE